MKERELQSGVGTTSVALAKHMIETLRAMLLANQNNDGFVPFIDRDVKIFDGQHRTTAYKIAALEVPEMAEKLEWIRVELWS